MGVKLNMHERHGYSRMKNWLRRIRKEKLERRLHIVKAKIAEEERREKLTNYLYPLIRARLAEELATVEYDLRKIGL